MLLGIIGWRALEDAPCLFLGNNKIVICYLIVILEVEVIVWWLIILYLLPLLHLDLSLEMHLNFEQNKKFESMLQASKIKGMQQQQTIHYDGGIGIFDDFVDEVDMVGYYEKNACGLINTKSIFKSNIFPPRAIQLYLCK